MSKIDSTRISMNPQGVVHGVGRMLLGVEEALLQVDAVAGVGVVVGVRGQHLGLQPKGVELGKAPRQVRLV